MKKIIFSMLIFILLGVGICASWEFDNVKEFNDAGDYGNIEIINVFGFGSTLAEYTLLKNSDYCGTNCFAEGTATLYNAGLLFSDMNAYDFDGELVSIQELKVYIHEYNQWVEYDNLERDPGVYEWRIEGKKNWDNSVDWIGDAQGVELSEWAEWNTPEGSQMVEENGEVIIYTDTSRTKELEDGRINTVIDYSGYYEEGGIVKTRAEVSNLMEATTVGTGKRVWGCDINEDEYTNVKCNSLNITNDKWLLDYTATALVAGDYLVKLISYNSTTDKLETKEIDSVSLDSIGAKENKLVAMDLPDELHLGVTSTTVNIHGNNSDARFKDNLIYESIPARNFGATALLEIKAKAAQMSWGLFQIGGLSDYIGNGVVIEGVIFNGYSTYTTDVNFFIDLINENWTEGDNSNPGNSSYNYPNDTITDGTSWYGGNRSGTNPKVCSVDYGEFHTGWASCNFTTNMDDVQDGYDTWNWLNFRVHGNIECEWSIGSLEAATFLWTANITYRFPANLNIDLNAPANNTVFNYEDINFNFTATDDVNTSMTCDIYIDNGLNKSIGCLNGTLNNTEITGFVDGIHGWYVEVSDGANTNQSAEWNFTVNTIFPDLTISSPTNTTYATSSIDLNVTTTATDESSRYYSINNTAYVNFTGNATLTLGDGNYNLTVFINDTVNNTNSSSVYFVVDTTFPTITITAPTNTTYTTSNISVNVSTTATDESSRYYSINNSEYVMFTGNTTIDVGDGNYNLTVFINDTANNTISSSVYFVMNAEFPDITISEPTNTTYATSSIDLNVTTTATDESSRYYSINNTDYVNFTGNATLTLGDGQYNVTVFMNDTVNNTASSSVYFVVDTTFPTITITAPTNTTYTTSNISVNVSTTATDESSRYYSINNSEYVMFTGNTTIDVGDGQYNLTVFMNDTANNTISASVYFVMNAVTPDMFLDFPENVTYLSTETISLNVSSTAADISTWYYSINDTANIIFTPNITLSLGPGNYNLIIFVNDTANNTNSTTIEFVVNGNPTIPTLQYPANNSVNTSTTNIVFKCNASTDANDDTIYYEFWGNFTTDLILQQNSTNETMTLDLEQNATFTWKCRAHDNISSSNFTSNWTITINTTRLSLIEESHTASVFEGETDTLKFNVSFSPYAVSNLNVTLFYNDSVFFNPGEFDVGSIKKAYSREVVVNKFINQTNISFVWAVKYMDVNGSLILNNFTYYQQITNITVDNCSINTNMVINFTLYDEFTRTTDPIVNGSIETDIQFRIKDTPSINWTFTVSVVNSTNLGICVSNISNISNYRVWSTTKYDSDVHVPEYHYLQNYNISWENVPVQIPLYDLEDARATTFSVVFRDNQYLPVANAIIDLWRFYVGEGFFLSVEHGKTNNDGETVLNFEVESVIYKFFVRKENNLLWESEQYQVVCQTLPCTLELQQTVSPISTIEYETFDNLVFSFTTNTSSRSANLIYNTIDGSTVDVSVNGTLLNGRGNTTACFVEQTSSGGTLTCTVPEDEQNATYYFEFRVSGNYAANRMMSLAKDAFANFGNTGIILTIILFATLVGMAAANGVGVVVFSILGIVTASSIGIFIGGSVIGPGSIILWVMVAGGMIIWKISKRRAQ